MRKAILGTVFLCFGIAGLAAADSVTLTSGSIALATDGPSSLVVNASGSGFTAAGSGNGGVFSGSFTVGDTVDLSRTISFVPGPTDFGSITSGNLRQSGYLGGTLQLRATPFVLGNASGSEFTTPFSLSGLFQLSAQPFGQSPLFSQEITGTGTATFGAKYIGNGQYLVDPAHGGLVLDFAPASTPSATPEPASLLLLTTGVVPLMLRRGRSRRQ